MPLLDRGTMSAADAGAAGQRRRRRSAVNVDDDAFVAAAAGIALVFLLFASAGVATLRWCLTEKPTPPPPPIASYRVRVVDGDTIVVRASCWVMAGRDKERATR